MKIDQIMLSLYPLHREYPDAQEECNNFAMGIFTTMYAVDREAQGLEFLEQGEFEDGLF